MYRQQGEEMVTLLPNGSHGDLLLSPLIAGSPNYHTGYKTEIVYNYHG